MRLADFSQKVMELGTAVQGGAIGEFECAELAKELCDTIPIKQGARKRLRNAVNVVRALPVEEFCKRLIGIGNRRQKGTLTDIQTLEETWKLVYEFYVARDGADIDDAPDDFELEC